MAQHLQPSPLGRNGNCHLSALRLLRRSSSETLQSRDAALEELLEMEEEAPTPHTNRYSC